MFISNVAVALCGVAEESITVTVIVGDDTAVGVPIIADPLRARPVPVSEPDVIENL